MESPKPRPILKQKQGISIAAKKVDSFSPNYSDHSYVEDSMPESSGDYFKKGTQKHSLKDYHGAISDLTTAIELNPQEASYYHWRCSSKAKLKDRQGAMSDFKKLIELGSQSAYYSTLGYVKHTLGDYEGAIYDYEQAIGLDSQSPNPYMWKGFTKHNQGDSKGAIFDYDKAIKLNPQYADAYSMRCFAKYDLKDYHGAITDFVQAIAYKPDNSVIENLQELEKVINEAKSKLISSQLPLFSDRQIKIQNICLERRIEKLIHFTHVKNLNSILCNGLIPRTTLKREQKPFSFNDKLRLDGYKNSISLSISFPNDKMFYKCRISNIGRADWVVLALDPSILWELECAFCYTNAASSEMTIMSIGKRKQPEYLCNMFEYNGQNRQALNLPDNHPTSSQAEVLCFDSISSDYIKEIHFCSELERDRWILENGEYAQYFEDKFYAEDSYFTKREDYLLRRK